MREYDNFAQLEVGMEERTDAFSCEVEEARGGSVLACSCFDAL